MVVLGVLHLSETAVARTGLKSGDPVPPSSGLMVVAAETVRGLLPRTISAEIIAHRSTGAGLSLSRVPDPIRGSVPVAAKPPLAR